MMNASLDVNILKIILEGGSSLPASLDTPTANVQIISAPKIFYLIKSRIFSQLPTLYDLL
jgi:hypothetical protein